MMPKGMMRPRMLPLLLVLVAASTWAAKWTERIGMTTTEDMEGTALRTERRV
jgi:hypothetical protein